MTSPSLTIFANFRINNEIRYRRMKNSFKSFKDINAQKWVINVRGKYKLKTILFLREELGEKLYPHMIESGKGWFQDTREMMEQIDTDFVFYWIEDHINMVDVKEYDDILMEMKENNVDHLWYSFWHENVKKVYKSISPLQTNHLDIYNMNLNTVQIIEKNMRDFFFIVSCASISSVDFFKKIIYSNHPRLKRWPKETPFDFEKRSTDSRFIPFYFAMPRFELFATIDDDHEVPGYSLMSRGLYNDGTEREKIQSMEYDRKKSIFSFVKYYVPGIIYKRLAVVYGALIVMYKRIKYTIR